MTDLATYYHRLRIAWAQHRRRYPGGPHLDAADRASIRAIWDAQLQETGTEGRDD